MFLHCGYFHLLNVKQCVFGCAMRVLANLRFCLVALCLLVHKLFICLFVQHESRCMHVLFSLRLQRLHNGEISCFSTWFFVSCN